MWSRGRFARRRTCRPFPGSRACSAERCAVATNWPDCGRFASWSDGRVSAPKNDLPCGLITFVCPGLRQEDIGGYRNCILREQVALGQIHMNSPQSPPQSPIERLKVLINSSTPIVVMETVEEVRALALVRAACSDLSLAVFEWTIADGLVRSASPPVQPPLQARAAMSQGRSEAGRFAPAMLSPTASDATAPKTAIY